VSFAKITERLPAFRPQWTVPQGITQMADDMRRFGLSAADFEGPRYVRLARVRELIASGMLDGQLRMRTVDQLV
jgi:hypothetical protein